MRAETDQREQAEREQAQHGRPGHPPALAPAARREHEERQRQARCDLDGDADDERRGPGAKARHRTRCERERGGEHHHDQRVVVRPADRQHEQHRVQADERRRPAPRLAELAGGARHERDGGEARGDGEDLERPQAARQAERRGGVAGKREQRSVGRVLIGPADEPEDFVASRLRGHVRVRVQAVQCPEAREAEVAEDVLGDQRRTQQQDRVGGDDRRDERAHRQGARERQHEQVAGAHDQRERLKVARAEAHAQALQRPGQPAGPAAAAPWDVLRWFSGGTGCREEDRHEDPQQAEQAERAGNRCRARQRPARAARSAFRAAGGLERRCGQSRGGRHRPIVTSTHQAGV